MESTSILKTLSKLISGYLQQLQVECIGTCKIAGQHAFIIEHDPTTGYTVTFQVNPAGGTYTEHFHYTVWDNTKEFIDNIRATQGQPPITDWKLKETVIV